MVAVLSCKARFLRAIWRLILRSYPAVALTGYLVGRKAGILLALRVVFSPSYPASQDDLLALARSSDATCKEDNMSELHVKRQWEASQLIYVFKGAFYSTVRNNLE